MAKIQELLEGKGDLIDYKQILIDNPWIAKKNQKCILSPDSDGLLCGLFMSHYLNWEIVGFYDGKVCVLKDGISAYDDDVCFLDIEIYRQGIKSMGHHMLSIYNSAKPSDWNEKFKNCIQPNLLRGYDRNSFRLKYPLSTIHLLIGILESEIEIDVAESAIFPLLFVDGTYKVMFSYPENVLNWWKYLRVQTTSKLLRHIFMGEDYTAYRLMIEMDNFFRERDEISCKIKKERGDKLVISNRNSSHRNFIKEGDLYKFEEDTRDKCIKFLKLLEKHTKWRFDKNNWNFEKMNLMQFTKSDFKGENWTITKVNHKKFMDLNPLSWAMTSSDNVEFTKEYPDKLI
ncbi:hypothetical protein [Kaistella polysaccharea]|uniref:hypothetical protein n=1 Tax=Kaistella polysaccharea TaxID=2878534 RepID=UPI001CF51B8C|nr:hypothetical protein [Kaistella polysaccharea]